MTKKAKITQRYLKDLINLQSQRNLSNQNYHHNNKINRSLLKENSENKNL
jgi:hypothetical protein